VKRCDFGQPWIPTGEQSGLLTHIATTEKRFVVRADEKLTVFLELEAAIRTSQYTAHVERRRQARACRGSRRK
jgi:hypothetical protein